MAEYTLPDLDYDYGALEPHSSGQINEIHHSKHHATYVKGVNDAIAALEEARGAGDHSAIFLHEKNLAFHLGGHVNHTIWWKNLSPDGGDKPTGELAAAIDDQFGEHAYYLQYRNVKADYVKAFWNVVNWADVQRRFTAATTQTPGLLF